MWVALPKFTLSWKGQLNNSAFIVVMRFCLILASIMLRLGLLTQVRIGMKADFEEFRSFADRAQFVLSGMSLVSRNMGWRNIKSSLFYIFTLTLLIKQYDCWFMSCRKWADWRGQTCRHTATSIVGPWWRNSTFETCAHCPPRLTDRI